MYEDARNSSFRETVYHFVHPGFLSRDILQIGGTAADAMVASLLCTGLFSTHSAGIGGGAFIVYYDRETKRRVFFNGREVAPLAASENMYENDTSASVKGDSFKLPKFSFILLLFWLQ